MRALLPDATFCFLGTLPRATIQGALAGRPEKGFFWHWGATQEGKHNAQFAIDTIAMGARLYVLVFSIVGSLLLDLCGPPLLRLSTRWAQRTCAAEPPAADALETLPEESEASSHMHWTERTSARAAAELARSARRTSVAEPMLPPPPQKPSRAGSRTQALHIPTSLHLPHLALPARLLDSPEPARLEHRLQAADGMQMHQLNMAIRHHHEHYLHALHLPTHHRRLNQVSLFSPPQTSSAAARARRGPARPSESTPARPSESTPLTAGTGPSTL